MENMIDVQGLPDEEIRLVQEFVEFLKEKRKQAKSKEPEKETEEIIFTAHPSDVIGKLTREEIYEHL